MLFSKLLSFRSKARAAIASVAISCVAEAMNANIISRKIGTESTYTGSRKQRRYVDYTLYTLKNGEYMLKEDIYNAWEEIPDRHLIFIDSTYTGNPDVEYINMQGKPICRECYNSRAVLEVE